MVIVTITMTEDTTLSRRAVHYSEDSIGIGGGGLIYLEYIRVIIYS